MSEVLSLYEILKASKTGIAPDMWTALAGMNWGGVDSGREVKELTGIPPLSIRSNGTMLLDYLISGNMSQTGTPTPTTPIQPQETGDRTGNLAKYWKPAYVAANGSITANRVNAVSFPVKIEIGETICFTNPKTNFGRGIAIFSEFDGKTLTNMLYRSTRSTDTYTADSDCYVIIWCNYDNTTSMNEAMFNLRGQMLNTGSTALPYEPYGYKLPISSAEQTNNIYLGEVQTTRRIKKLVLTGEENITSGHLDISLFNMPVNDYIWEPIISLICTHYEPQQNAVIWSQVLDKKTCFYTGGNVGFRQLYIRDTSYSTIADFKSYLQQQYANGTPVTIWYVLATPETVTINEPIRKIGNYADTVSYEQAGVQIPTNKGNTVIDVLTELKPSEMYIKYQE